MTISPPFASDLPELLLPGEVAALLRVNVTTLQRWEKRGKLTAIRTLGNHRRYRRDDVQALLAGWTEPGSWR